MSIRLTDDEAWEMLAASAVGILTTLRADGSPVTLPTWFAVLDRTVCFSTPSRAKKVARIRRDPRASFLVEAGERWADLRAVHLSGHVEAVGGDPVREIIEAALNEKYAALRTPRAQMPRKTAQHYAASRTFFRFVPGPRILTWDNRRLAPREAG